MEKILIDKELCIGCGECVKDCVTSHLKIVDGQATTRSNRCIECGHCYAICPTGAVSMAGYSTEGLDKIKSFADYDSDELLLAMKSRRTVRRFKEQEVSKEDVLKIIEAGRYSPTGSNAQDVSFIVLKEHMAECEAAAVEVFKRAQSVANTFYPPLKNTVIDDNFFFKGAPLVILTAANSTRNVNPGLASSYMELMAESLGLGVLYSGFFVFAAKHSKAIKQILDLPDGQEIVTCMVIGHPDVKYQRLAPRKAANLYLR